MLARLFGRELSEEDKTEAVAKIRAEFPDDDLPDATLRRFLIARDWDQKATKEMLQSHLQWKKDTLPMEKTEAVQKVLDSGRVRVFRRGATPIICYDFMWGKFLLDGYDADDILKAMIWVAEDVVPEADAAAPEGEQAKYISISTGGPPPKEFIKKISPIFDVNYPERLQFAIIYPIPTVMKWVANAILMLVPKKTREKFVMFSEEAELLEKTGLKSEDLPEDMKGGIEAARERGKKAMEDEKTKDQLPEEFKQAMENPDQNLQTMMSQAAC